MHNITATAAHNHCSFLRLTCEVYFAVKIPVRVKERERERLKEQQQNIWHRQHNIGQLACLLTRALYPLSALALSLEIFRFSHFDIPPHHSESKSLSRCARVDTWNMCSIVLFLFGAAAVCVFILHSSARSTATEFDFRKSFAGESRQTRERPKLFSNMNLSVGERESHAHYISWFVDIFPCYRYKSSAIWLN